MTHPHNPVPAPASAWPGFPFPPPMMGMAPATASAAASRWLREVSALLDTGEMNLNTLFASAPVHLALREHALPERSLPVVTAAGMYALGAVSPTGPRTLCALFAAPTAVHRARLAATIDLLAEG